MLVVIRNRSAPPSAVMPVLGYPDVPAAVDWLHRAFGLVEHVRVGDHRAQVGFGDGALFIADTSNGRTAPGADLSHSVMIRVPDVDAHYRIAVAAGAQILAALTDHVYGERQYTAVDPAGHRWTFTQSVADVAPEEWGGTTVVPW
jgi:uncharacterized glyoxalase superfamily protein PhnB